LIQIEIGFEKHHLCKIEDIVLIRFFGFDNGTKGEEEGGYCFMI